MNKEEAIEHLTMRMLARELIGDVVMAEALNIAIKALSTQREEKKMCDIINRQDAIDAVERKAYRHTYLDQIIDIIKNVPSAKPEIIKCEDCKYWRRQTNYQGTPLSFGFCECDDMWRSLYGETYEVSHIDTDDDFYCGYAKRRTDG